MSPFATYLLGFLILIVGLAVAAYLLNVPPVWIVVALIVVLVVGAVLMTRRAKPRDPPPGPAQ